MKGKTFHTIFLSITLFGVFGCTSEPLFRDHQKRAEINSRFEQQKKLVEGRSKQLFDVFQKQLTAAEEDALKLLYAYMPLSDLAIYDGDFFLKQAQTALQARQHFSWGSSVPDDIFLHYVLPVRVNNEYLDSGRVVFFHELKERLKGLTLKEAALEVNHWCHEKVTYQSTDEYRTSSPLNTVKTAFGRCGEQSTFTVAAMRAACIPARQVYTPRWAHTNDNHAWVEVWIDGHWYFLGACEPQPSLNMGWFESPATRAMLIHSKVYGHLISDGDIISQNQRFTEINLLNDYANTRLVHVKVVDESGRPVPNAKVEFQLVNFSELFPLAVKTTNEEGYCSLTTGIGDLMVWASNNGLIANGKIDHDATDTLSLSLKQYALNGTFEAFLLKAPEVGAISEKVEISQNHYRRLYQEDSIRAAYEASFIDSVTALQVSQNTGIEKNTVWQLLKESRGNWDEIQSFLQYAGKVNGTKAVALLSVVLPKDRRDTPRDVFIDHFVYSEETYCANSEMFQQYVLNPRIHNELLSNYKKTFRDFFGRETMVEMALNIELLANWVNKNITVISDANDWNVPVLPTGVLELRVADVNSRNIFFAAAARSIGIPARIEAVTKQPQVYIADNWVDVNLETGRVMNSEKGELVLQYTKKGNDERPVYYLNFTIARFDGSGFKTLDFSNAAVFSMFPAKVSLPVGSYSLLTSTRLPDGSVKARRQFFDVKAGTQVEIGLQIPDASVSVQLLNKAIDLNREFNDLSTGKVLNIQSLNREKGLVLIWLNPGLEPSKHLINDLKRLKANFDNWAGNIAVLLAPQSITPGFNPTQIVGLPQRVIFLKDDSAWLKQIDESSQLSQSEELPKVFVINSEGKIMFQSSGYRIGIGDDILNQLKIYCNVNQ